MEHQLVIMKLGNEHYGVDIANVESIIKMQEITALPRAPEFVEGVINLRGTIIPIIDMRKRFDMPLVEATRDTRIVVVEIRNLTVGMVVDAVNEVLRVADEDIEPPSQLVTTVDSAFIIGIAKVADRLIILLDLSKVLSGNEQAALQTVAEAV